MNPARIQYATTDDGVSIAYLRIGQGTPIVFASNVWGDAHLYANSEPYICKITDSLVALGWQVILYDGRGMGSSDRQAIDFNLDARKKDLAAVTAKMGFDRFVLAAYDIAGPTAVAYTIQAQERVSHLVLLNANASTAMRRQASPSLRTLRSPEGSAPDEWEFRTLTLASIDTRFGDAEKAREVAATFRAGMSQAAFLAYVEANASLEVSELLSRIRAPALVVYDKTGPFGAFESCQNLAARIPDARLVATEEAPAAIHEFLAASLSAPVPGFQIEEPSGAKANAKPRPYPDGLSGREVEVLRLVAAGKTNQQIADQLVISLNTVTHHVSNIFNKSGAANRTEAAAYAHRSGLI